MKMVKVALIFALFVFVAACSQDNAQQSDSSGSKTGMRNPDFVPFEYMAENTKRDIKATVDARLEWDKTSAPSKDQIMATAEHIASMYDTKNKFVRIYLPGMDIDSSAYALYSKRGSDPADLSVFESSLPDQYKEPAN